MEVANAYPLKTTGTLERWNAALRFPLKGPFSRLAFPLLYSICAYSCVSHSHNLHLSELILNIRLYQGAFRG